MEGKLTEEAVELQQCARRRNSTTASLPYPGSPPPAASTFGPARVEHDSLLDMATTTDSAFVDDVDVEREIRVRASTRPYKSGATSPGPDNDNEDAPLLHASRDDYGSSHGDDDDDENNTNREQEWAGDADFRGLPWWKRPSVRASRLMRRNVDD
jgi:hypothetical protein